MVLVHRSLDYHCYSGPRLLTFLAIKIIGYYILLYRLPITLSYRIQNVQTNVTDKMLQTEYKMLQTKMFRNLKLVKFAENLRKI